MSDPHKSFFSSMPGVVTGVAGLLSAMVGVAGLAFQQGWVGGSTNAARPGTVAPGQSAPQSSATFSVDPARLTFEPLGPRQATVTVRNTGLVSLQIEPPVITGADAALKAAG